MLVTNESTIDPDCLMHKMGRDPQEQDSRSGRLSFLPAANLTV